MKSVSRLQTLLTRPLLRMASTRGYCEAIEQLNETIQQVAFIHCVKPGDLRKTRSGRVRLFLPMIGISDDDLERLRIVHVAGSKGKGSTCSTVESVLRHMGYRTGFLSSPHLINVEERIRIDGRPIMQDHFAQLFWDVHEAIMARSDEDTPKPTYLHYLVLMACKAFVTEKVDAAIIEVGIGGRYDHTNFFATPAVSAVTTLSLEHTEVLGNTLEEIAWKKAGVLKAGCPAVISRDQTEGTLKVFEKEANAVGCPLFLAPEFDQLVLDDPLARQILSTMSTPSGREPGTVAVRLRNLCLSMATVHLWLEQLNGVRFEGTGALATRWPGRWQKVQRGTVAYFIDGAHTEESVQNTAEWFQWETRKRSANALIIFLLTALVLYTSLKPSSESPRNTVDHTKSYQTMSTNPDDLECAKDTPCIHSDPTNLVDKSAGPLDELSLAEYILVLDALRSQISSLYAFDPRVDENHHPAEETADKRLSRTSLQLYSRSNQLKVTSLWTVTYHELNKTERSAFFETRRSSQMNPKPPLRFALAVVFRVMDQLKPEVQEFLVGPLKAQETELNVTLIRVLAYHKRPLGTTEYEALLDKLSIICSTIDPILQQAYDASYFLPFDTGTNSTQSACISGDSRGNASYVSGNPRCLQPVFASPMVTREAPEARRSWFRLVHQVAPFFQYPVDVQFNIDHTYLDPEQWQLVQIWFQGQTYPSADALLNSYTDGSLNITRKPFFDMHQNLFHPGPRQRDSPIPFNPVATNAAIRPASFIQQPMKLFTTSPPTSNRYSQQESPKRTFNTKNRPQPNRISIQGRHVEYLDWSFHITVRRNTGLRVFDIRFADNLLVSEAGLDETVTAYWGHSPFMRTMTSIESMFGVGAMLSELSPGVDCPRDAIFLPVQMIPSADLGPRPLRQGICIFEWSTDSPGGPLRRHFEFNPLDHHDTTGATNFASGVTSKGLIVRTISSLFNYDYLFDVIFHSSGSIEFAVTPTGYIHVDVMPTTGGRESPQEGNMYGFKSNSAPIYFVIHQHFFHYKLDLDVLGEKNFVRLIQPHGPSNWNGDSNEASLGENGELWMNVKEPHGEKEAQFHMRFEKPMQYLVCQSMRGASRDGSERNPRCLAVQNKGAIPSLFSWNHTKSFPWARYQLRVTQHHDSEPSASSMYNGVDLTDPVVDAEQFSQNNESIYNEMIRNNSQDLVLWLTMGNVHIPRHEDLPNTVTSSGRLSFILHPHNLFQHSPDAYSCQRVFTRSIDEWIQGFQQPSTCNLEPVPLA